MYSISPIRMKITFAWLAKFWALIFSIKLIGIRQVASNTNHLDGRTRLPHDSLVPCIVHRNCMYLYYCRRFLVACVVNHIASLLSYPSNITHAVTIPFTSQYNTLPLFLIRDLKTENHTSLRIPEVPASNLCQNTGCPNSGFW